MGGVCGGPLSLFSLRVQIQVDDGHGIRDVDGAVVIHVCHLGVYIALVLGQVGVDHRHGIRHVHVVVAIGITRQQCLRVGAVGRGGL